MPYLCNIFRLIDFMRICDLSDVELDILTFSEPENNGGNMGAVTRPILFRAATNECFCLFYSKLVRRAKSAIGSIYAGIQDRDLDLLSPADFELQLLEVFEPLIRLPPPIIRSAHALEINAKGCRSYVTEISSSWLFADSCPPWEIDGSNLARGWPVSRLALGLDVICGFGYELARLP